MSFGYFYEITDSAREHFVGCTTKSEWYEVLGELNIEDYSSCEGKQSFPGWQLALGGLSGPLARMFEGDLRAERNEFDDPDAVFLGSDLVKLIAAEIDGRGREFFECLLRQRSNEIDISNKRRRRSCSGWEGAFNIRQGG